MRTTLDLNPDLLQQAMRETHAKSKTAVVQMGLEALLAIEARKRLKTLFGKVRGLEKAPRRRA
ncbi:MAG TPA: type II toxin-antitoxin system VapB family antitoxin [Vicinamibacteria bacterium]|nr:type II toxin-antitoxin system VapB family antitoxin [Vicinamibacteria bacterium]HRB11855.1 type II toxin-antitoxin system VapB family antitoxin [Vicinamibacteria bacterium]